MRLLLGVICLGLAVAACSGEDTTPTLAPGPTSTANTVPTTTVVASPSTETSAATPTTPASTSSTVTNPPEGEVPIPQTAGEEDFELIWRELIEYHNWAFQNPQQADPAIYISRDCDCFANAQERLAEYQDNGWQEISDGLIVHSVDVDLATSTFALMTVIDEHSPLIVVNSAGETVRQRERRPKTFYDVRVRLHDEGWRIVEWFQRGAVGDAE